MNKKNPSCKTEDLEERISEAKLSELVERLKRIVSWEQAPAFIIGYCASDDKIFADVSDYVKQQLGIEEADVKYLEFEKEGLNLYGLLKQQKAELQSCKGDVLLVKVNGIERHPRFPYDGDYLHTLHWLGQTVLQGQKQTFEGLTKKVVVIAHIGKSEGNVIYERAIKSALDSQFKHFFYEFE